MGLPSSGEMKASMINVEAARAANKANTKTGGDGASSDPADGSLVKLYNDATPSPVDQNAPYAYSEFYGKSFTSPPVTCGDTVVATGNVGYYELQATVGTGTGAVIVYFNPRAIPDGIQVVYNSIKYNTLTSNALGYAGATAGYLNFVGYDSYSNCGASYLVTASTPSGINVNNFVWNGNSFGANGTTSNTGVFVAGQFNLVNDIVFRIYTMVIPKPATTPSIIQTNNLGLCGTTKFDVHVLCPAALPSFTTNSVSSTFQDACCATQNQTYYFARNAMPKAGGNVDEITVDTNSLPQVGNFVFSNNTGATALANGWYQLTANSCIQVSNGVVNLLSTGCAACNKDFQSSSNQTFNGVCAASIAYTYSHDGSGTFPAAGDRVFDENDNPVVSGYYKFNSTFVYQTTLNVVNAGWPQNFC